MSPLILPLFLAALPLRAADVPRAEVKLSSAQSERTSALQMAFQTDPVKAKAFAAAAPESVLALCEKAKPNCGSAKTLLADATTFAELSPVLTDMGYDPYLVKARYSKISLLFFRLFSIEEFTRMSLEPVLAVIVNAICEYDATVAAQLTGAETSLDQRLIVLEAETKELEDKDKPTQADVTSLKQDHLSAFDAFKSLSFGIDSFYEPEAPVTIAHREKANELALQLAALRERLISLEEKVGLPPSAVVDLTETMRSKKMIELLQLTKKKKIGKRRVEEVDYVAILAPAGPSEAPKPIDPGGAKGLSVKERKRKTDLQVKPVPTLEKPPEPSFDAKDLNKSEMKAKFLRWTGLAKVEGEPKKRALLVHGQTGPTCAIVAQQQLLLAYGVLPGGDQAALEDMLESTAAASGFYDKGTPNKFMGNLLVQYGLLIVKHVDASDYELESAAKSGKMLLVSVDAGIFWNLPKHMNSGHAVLVTGVEFMRGSGKVLGYYVNDSGFGPTGVGGRFVPIEQFLAAWHARGSRYIEIQ